MIPSGDIGDHGDVGPADDARIADVIDAEGMVFLGPGAFEIAPYRVDPPGPGEVRVRMAASGICHSDLHVLDGHWTRPAPLVMGHEGAGWVEAVGPDAIGGASPGPRRGPRVGDLVVLAWTAPCGRCAACRRGEGWLCAAPAGSGHRFADERDPDPTAGRDRPRRVFRDRDAGLGPGRRRNGRHQGRPAGGSGGRGPDRLCDHDGRGGRHEDRPCPARRDGGRGGARRRGARRCARGPIRRCSPGRCHRHPFREARAGP